MVNDNLRIEYCSRDTSALMIILQRALSGRLHDTKELVFTFPMVYYGEDEILRAQLQITPPDVRLNKISVVFSIHNMRNNIRMDRTAWDINAVMPTTGILMPIHHKLRELFPDPEAEELYQRCQYIVQLTLGRYEQIAMHIVDGRKVIPYNRSLVEVAYQSAPLYGTPNTDIKHDGHILQAFVPPISDYGLLYVKDTFSAQEVVSLWTLDPKLRFSEIHCDEKPRMLLDNQREAYQAYCNILSREDLNIKHTYALRFSYMRSLVIENAQLPLDELKHNPRYVYEHEPDYAWEASKKK